MNDALKALENLGAELGAAKAENEKLRKLLTTLRISLNLDDTEYGLSKQEKSSLAAEIDAALSPQAEPMCETMQRPKAECGCPDCGSSLIDWPTAEPTDAFTATDMINQSAQGFRDGQAAQVTYPDFRPQLSALVKACQRYIDSDGAECFPDDALIEATVALERDAHAASVRYATRPAQTEQQPVGYANFRNGRFGNWLHPTEEGAKNFDKTALAGRPAGSTQVALYAAPIAQTAPNSDCEWCAGAGKDHFGEKCEHCQTAPQPEQSELIKALEEIAAGEKTVWRDDHFEVENDMAIDYPGIAKAALDAYRAALSAQGQSNGDS